MLKKDLLLAILVAAIWGANYSVIEMGLASLDPFLLTALRFTLCAIPLCFIIKKPRVNIKYVALYGLIFGVGLWGIANLAMFVGLPPGTASLLLQFSAFFTIILSIVFFQEKIQLIQYIGMALAIIGLVFILYSSNGELPIRGVALIILAAFSWSLCNIIVKKHKPTEMMSFIIWSSIFSALPLFIITYLINGSAPFLNLGNSLTIKAIFSLCFQAYITTLFGYWVWNMLMKKYTAAAVAPISLLIPIFGIITSHFIFGEIINLTKLISTSLIIIGIMGLIYRANTR